MCRVQTAVVGDSHPCFHHVYSYRTSLLDETESDSQNIVPVAAVLHRPVGDSLHDVGYR